MLREQCRRLRDRGHSPFGAGRHRRHDRNGQRRSPGGDGRFGRGDGLPFPCGCRLGRADPVFRPLPATARRHRAGRLGDHRRPQAALRAHGCRHGLFKDPTALSAIEHHAAYISAMAQGIWAAIPSKARVPAWRCWCMPASPSSAARGMNCSSTAASSGSTFADISRPSRIRTGQRAGTQHPHLPLYPGLGAKDPGGSPGRAGSQHQRTPRQDLEAIAENQREAGKTFVSRTRLAPGRYNGDKITVLRVVMANPLTTEEILAAVLDDNARSPPSRTSRQCCSRSRNRRLIFR